MGKHLKAVYENAVLRFLEPVDLEEYQHVIVTIDENGVRAPNEAERVQQESPLRQRMLTPSTVRSEARRLTDVHDADLIAELRHNTKVVGNQQHGDVEHIGKLFQQFVDVLLGGHERSADVAVGRY